MHAREFLVLQSNSGVGNIPRRKLRSSDAGLVGLREAFPIADDITQTYAEADRME